MPKNDNCEKITKVITGKCRASYANLLVPKAVKDDDKLKNSCSIIVPKSDKTTVDKIKAAIQAAYELGENKLKGNGKTAPPLDKIRTPLRDGDSERGDDPAYENSYFVNANSDVAPGIVDKDRNPILDAREIYSGMYARFSLNFYAYNTRGNRGVGCGLNNIQKLADGEALGGKSRAEDDFNDSYSDDDYDDNDFLF